MLCPASPDEAGLFYALPPEKDEELGAIGHLRIDFGHRGQKFWHTWRPRGPEELNSPEFKEELGKVVDDLRKSVLKNLTSMRRYCSSHDGKITGGSCCQNYGFVLETERYIYAYVDFPSVSTSRSGTENNLSAPDIKYCTVIPCFCWQLVSF